MAELQIAGVEKVYPNGFKAIHGIDLEVVDGEFIVLVGPSGCGKSTLPNSLSNIVRVASVRSSSRRMPVAASVACRRRALSSPRCWGVMRLPDRKSTRLNSSH